MRILIVEDDFRIADLVNRSLQENGHECIICYDGLKANRLIQTENFDLVVSDVMLPGMDGIELCKSIKKIKPELPVLMITALGSTDDKVEGFDAGADDYLVKPFEVREFLARVKALLKRSKPANEKYLKTIKYENLEMDLDQKRVWRAGEEINLTPKEFKLLEFLLKNKDRVLSRSEIASHVWETHFDTGTNFIDVYINYLRKKIDKPYEPKLIHTKPGMGFILKVDAE
jgi:DNA-binding response OmpR family regulator